MGCKVGTRYIIRKVTSQRINKFIRYKEVKWRRKVGNVVQTIAHQILCRPYHTYLSMRTRYLKRGDIALDEGIITQRSLL